MRSKDRQYIPTMPAKPAPSLWQRLRGAASVAVSAVRSAGARVVAFVARKATGARAALSRVVRKAMVHRPWILTRDGAKDAVSCVTHRGRIMRRRAASLARTVRASLVFRPWILTRDGAQDAVSRATEWCRTTWSRVIRPFLHVRVVALGIGAVVIGLSTAPVATLTVLAGCGAALVGLSRLIEHLEGSVRPSACVVLRVIEAAAQALRVVVYVAAGAAVLAIGAASAAFAVTEVLELVLRYLDVRLAVSVATLAFFVLTASWGLVLAEIAWLALVHERKPSSRATRADSGEHQAIPLIRIDAERAWNGDAVVDIVPGTAVPMATAAEMQETLNMTKHVERAVNAGFQVPAHVLPATMLKACAQAVRVDTAKCMGCDLDDRSPRYRIGNMSSLCGTCFEYLVEDELVAAADRGEVSAEDVTAAVRAGISVPAYVVIVTGARLRSTRINLDIEDITCHTEARALSEKDLSKVHWAETGWWFDGRSNRRARRWHGFVSGRIAVMVEYQHEKDSRGFYVVASDSSWDRGPFRKLETAQDAAADEISDRQLAQPPQGIGGAFVGVLLAAAGAAP